MEQNISAAPVRIPGVISERATVLRNRRITHIFHITAVVYMVVWVVIGFWPSYFGQLFTGMPDRHWVIHLHAAVFTGWLLLLLLQVSLVAAGKTRYHKKLGIAGGAYGILILALGLAAAIVLPVQNVGSGLWTLDEAAGFLVLPLGDMIMFGGLFGAALWYRGRSEVHKRFILAASVVLVFPAVARFFGETQIPALVLVWLFPLLVGLILDGALHRKVHPVYLISTVILLLSIARVMLMESEAWLRIGRGMLGVFM